MDQLSGPALVGEHFLVEILTMRGSLTYLPDRGCGFLENLSYANTEFDIFNAFAAARLRLHENLSLALRGRSPDEQYKDASLEEIGLRPDGVMLLRFRVETRSGDHQVVSLPPLGIADES